MLHYFPTKKNEIIKTKAQSASRASPIVLQGGRLWRKELQTQKALGQPKCKLNFPATSISFGLIKYPRFLFFDPNAAPVLWPLLSSLRIYQFSIPSRSLMAMGKEP